MAMMSRPTPAAKEFHRPSRRRASAVLWYLVHALVIVKIANGIKDLPGKGDVPALDGEGLLRPTGNGQLRQRQWVTPSSDLTAESSYARSLKASSSERAESSDEGYGNDFCVGLEPKKECTHSEGLVSKATSRSGKVKSTSTWNGRVRRNMDRMVDSNCQKRVVWYGDSIIERWEDHETDHWEKRYGTEHGGYPSTFGAISGDRSGNLLWRLHHGELGHINPAAFVVHIGINDVLDIDRSRNLETRREIALEAIKIAQNMESILGSIREKYCDTHIIVVGLLTVGNDEETDYSWPSRQSPIITMVNYMYKILSRLNWGIHFVDCQPHFLEANSDGDVRIDRTRMPDTLHPSKAGYEALANCVDDQLEDLGLHKRQVDSSS